MRVEIDISEEEAAEARAGWEGVHDHSSLCCRLTARLVDKLPRPIAVGDKVEFEWNLGRYRAVVLAIDGKWGWLGYDQVGAPITKLLDDVTLVEGVVS